MTGTEIYNRALTSLGYADDNVFKNKAVVVINQIYDLLYPAIEGINYKPIKTLGDKINLPERVSSSALVYGVAERLALGEGDGELQQYFALQFDRAKARINHIDKVVDVMP